MSDIEYERLRRGARNIREDLDIDESDDAAGLVLAAAEVLADLGPVLDAFFAAVRLSATSSDGAVDMNYDVCMDALLTAWTTARAKQVDARRAGLDRAFARCRVEYAATERARVVEAIAAYVVHIAGRETANAMALGDGTWRVIASVCGDLADHIRSHNWAPPEEESK